MTKRVSKKVQVQAETSVEVPVVAAPVVQAAAVAPVPVAAAEPKKTGRKMRSQDTREEAKARWARRLARWAKKTEAAGVDAKGLMQEALAA